MKYFEDLVGGVSGFGVLCLAVGCSVEPPSSQFDDQKLSGTDVGVDVVATDDVALGSGPGAGTMSGVWALGHRGSTCVLGQEQITDALYRVVIDGEDVSLHESRALCAMELTSVLGLTPVIPKATRESIQFPEVDRGYVTGLRVGSSYVSSVEVGLWGLDLEDPMNDPLPDMIDDAAVVDRDEDDNPGVTVVFEESECARYVVQRQRISYQGLFTTPNRIEGKSANFTEVNVLDSTQVLCGVSPPLVANDQRSSFVMVRVDGLGGAPDLDRDRDGEVSCEEISFVFDSLFEPTEPDPSTCR